MPQLACAPHNGLANESHNAKGGQAFRLGVLNWLTAFAEATEAAAVELMHRYAKRSLALVAAVVARLQETLQFHSMQQCKQTPEHTAAPESCSTWRTHLTQWKTWFSQLWSLSSRACVQHRFGPDSDP